MAGFFYRKHMLGLTTGAVGEYIIDASQTITIGDAVRLVSGYIQLAGIGNPVWGVVTGIVDAKGNNIDSSVADVDGTVSGSGDTLTYVSAADNTTDKKVKAVVVTDPFVLWYNDADEDIAQAEVGTYYDVLAASDQIDGSTTTTSGQFQLVQWDPDGDADASKGLFKIAEWQGDL